MRMRRKPWARPELDASDIYIKNPYDYFGDWQRAFAKNQPLHIELGCGKGGFISKKAVQNPDINYLAFDIKSEVLATAKRNIEAEYAKVERVPENVKLAAFDIERILLVISEKDKAQRIYINFCNPWPKKSHQKRRLTHPKQLEHYKEFLAQDGQVYFKTDDDELFADSLEYFAQSGYSVDFITYDMENSPLPQNVVTEHEQMFMQDGKKIKGLIASYTSEGKGI
ncbi:MAG: tRNA (guanosine(46)-N7)-methyltransferase TrmB [Oscillospiraceae bacterium]